MMATSVFLKTLLVHPRSTETDKWPHGGTRHELETVWNRYGMLAQQKQTCSRNVPCLTGSVFKHGIIVVNGNIHLHAAEPNYGIGLNREIIISVSAPHQSGAPVPQELYGRMEEYPDSVDQRRRCEACRVQRSVLHGKQQNNHWALGKEAQHRMVSSHWVTDVSILSTTRNPTREKSHRFSSGLKSKIWLKHNTWK